MNDADIWSCDDSRNDVDIRSCEDSRNDIDKCRCVCRNCVYIEVVTTVGIMMPDIVVTTEAMTIMLTLTDIAVTTHGMTLTDPILTTG